MASSSQIVTMTAAVLVVLVCLASCAQQSDRFMYSMGLGKRSRPYSFGLGKRGEYYVPSKAIRDRHVFGFGLGKRGDEEMGNDVGLEDDSEYFTEEAEKRGGGRPYSFGLGKRQEAGKSFYSFGLGKRDILIQEARNPAVSVVEPSKGQLADDKVQSN